MLNRFLALAVLAGVFAAAPLAVPASAAAQGNPQPTWNQGYNGWWPAGFGWPPATVQTANRQCSVTAYGPTFAVSSGAGGWVQRYGAGTSCQGGVGNKRLSVSDQVLGPDHKTWFTITGSTVNLRFSSSNPIHLIHARPASLGHVYRTVARATIIAPNRHAGCSLARPPDCTVSYHLTVLSRPIAPGTVLLPLPGGAH